MYRKQMILQRILNEYGFNKQTDKQLFLDVDDYFYDEDEYKITMTSEGYIAYHRLTTLLYELNKIINCLPQIKDIIYALDFIVEDK